MNFRRFSSYSRAAVANMNSRWALSVIAVSCVGAVSAQTPQNFPSGITIGGAPDSYFDSWSAGGSRTTTEITSMSGGLVLYSDVKETALGLLDGGIAMYGNPLTFVPASSPDWNAGGTFDVWNPTDYGNGTSTPVFRIDTGASIANFNTLDITITNGTLTVAGSPALTTASAPTILTNQGFLQLSGGVLNIPSSTLSSSSTTGALTVAGGIGIGMDSYINGVRIGKGGGGVVSNIGLGGTALQSNTSGFNNTASGVDALKYNTTGYNNTSSGNSSLAWNTSGANNSAFGSYSLYANTTGASNTAAGVSSLQSNSTGNYNTASGDAFTLFQHYWQLQHRFRL